jgi:hypothetical protein
MCTAHGGLGLEGGWNMHYEARFVIDTHGQMTNLYKAKRFWSGFPAAPDEAK